MLCRDPFIRAGAAFPCGRCEPCRFNKRRLWTHRIMLEKMCHSSSVFVTVTYDDKHLPRDEGIPILVKKDLQDFMKRFRFAIAPLKVRFFGVGEYGDKTHRPHFHVIVFGIPECSRGQTKRNSTTGRSDWVLCCDTCRLFGDTWGFGDVIIGEVTKDSASYVASYTLKKMTKADDIRLNGRPPEFATMSLKPGIGADAMWDVASTMLSNSYRTDCIDVPLALSHGLSNMPLGRYLRTKLRLFTGKDGGTPEEVFKAMAEEMRPLREAAFNSSSSLKSAVIAAGDQTVANINARRSIFKKGKIL